MPRHVDYTEFACIHGEDGPTKMEALLDEVRGALSKETDEHLGFEVTDSNFVDSIVWSLSLDFNANITGIHSDQWHAVAAKDYAGWRTYIQCDQVEHGLAATWKAFAEHTERMKRATRYDVVRISTDETLASFDSYKAGQSDLSERRRTNDYSEWEDFALLAFDAEENVL